METELGYVDDWGLGCVLSGLSSGGVREKGPDLVDVDGWAELSVEVSSEDTDTLLTEMTWMVLEDV